MNTTQLQQLEALTEKAYTSPSHAERTQAEEALKVFATPEYLNQCRFILDHSLSDYATLFAGSSMMKVLTNSWNNYNVQERIEIRNYLLNLLATRGPTISQYVGNILIQVLARVTKFAWFDDTTHQEITDSVSKFLEASVPHYIIGLKILNELINEMNQSTGGHLTLTQHRKIAISFRDKALLRIFQISLNSLKQMGTSTTDAAQKDKIRDQALKLALQCLSFDFIGITPDESAEDLGIVQIPATWRSIFEDPGTLSLFLDLYRNSSPPQSTQTMECLVQLASVRRSLFVNEDDLSVYLTQLIHGIRDILKNSTGLNENSNHHGFCRLLARLKSNYQLNQLIAIDCYQEWINLVAEFTIKSIQSWEWAPNSIHYLLSLWSKLVSSMAYLKGHSPSLLDNFAPQITEAFIQSRLESVKNMVKSGDDDDDDLFADDDRMSETLEVLPYLGRCKYQVTSGYLVNLFDPLAASLSTEATTSKNMPIIEGQLTWLVYIIGAILGGRGAIASPEEHDLIDGELAARVFQLMRLNDQVINQTQSHSPSKVKLELALLYFIQQFRKVYIGDQSMSSSKVYKRLSELLGIANHSVVLNSLLSKITTNLKYWAEATVIIEKTLSLFHDLAGGYSSGRLIVKLDITNQILQHNTSQFFKFLEIGSNTRNRTTFYTTLGKLLFMEDNITKFDEFMMPFEKTFEALLTLNSVQAFRQESIKNVVIGLFRDLRGLTSSINSRRAYNMFFDWIYPKYMSVLHKVSEAWFDTPSATTPLLKFVAEFVLNKSGRLTFDCSSPNGILLFRETSQILVTYGSRILSRPIVKDAYAEKYKGMALCLIILQRTLCGNYVNFGVFALYGDMALSNALGIALKLALSLPLDEMLAFPKMARAYFSFLDVLCSNHPSSVLELETPIFTQLVVSMQEGLKSLDPIILTQSCAALDHLISSIYHQGRKDTPASRALQRHMGERPLLFSRILEYLLRVILFEDCANQGSISRPMLGLILTHTKYYHELKASILANQPVHRRERLGNVFNKLMDDVQDNLEPRNRDKFTTNLTMFRHESRKV